MAYVIRKMEPGDMDLKLLFIHSEIDPGGMSVCWMGLSQADIFERLEDAESMLKRVIERYPNTRARIELA